MPNKRAAAETLPAERRSASVTNAFPETDGSDGMYSIPFITDVDKGQVEEILNG